MVLNSLKIGISFDREGDYPNVSGPSDRFAEFEPESTIEAMEQAILVAGHVPVRLGAPRALLLQKPDVDVIWNIAEGYGTRNREAWAPVLAELWGIPCLGSDAHSMSISLDKVLTKFIAGGVGLSVTNSLSALSVKELDNYEFDFPVFVKPQFEGTAKGISPESKCANLDELRRTISNLSESYRQPLLVEPFLPGAEFTCAVGGFPLRAFPVLERALEKTTGIGLHAVEPKMSTEPEYILSHSLTPELEKQLQNWSLRLCQALQVKHWARLDFKLDAAGNPFFLEINPLPTFGIGQTFHILAELDNRNYPEFLAELLTEALGEALQ